MCFFCAYELLSLNKSSKPHPTHIWNYGCIASQNVKNDDRAREACILPEPGVATASMRTA